MNSTIPTLVVFGLLTLFAGVTKVVDYLELCLATNEICDSTTPTVEQGTDTLETIEAPASRLRGLKLGCTLSIGSYRLHGRDDNTARRSMSEPEPALVLMFGRNEITCNGNASVASLPDANNQYVRLTCTVPLLPDLLFLSSYLEIVYQEGRGQDGQHVTESDQAWQ